ncbi:serine hydrolase domain-containing protein [Algihabitans albus]|uniref:serine hydrolase domain-containing protein n=1 Tax=Algihabitans albus TaxID=2164067 RepID=UPI000E5DA546|nr:serine hydrolase domain-containing protein [Algihabitans albus]
MARARPAWLSAALDYLPQWLEFQMRATEQPGCSLAVAHKGEVIWEQAFGQADLSKTRALTPRHRFRAASHSKTFTASAILLLREAGKLRLDDPVGDYVEGLHPKVAEVTLMQVLSHSAGLVRDGEDSGHWMNRRAFPDRKALRAALSKPPVIEGSTQLKYSNHGYALLGLVIEAVTGESFGDWIRREVIQRAGLKETEPDGPPAKSVPFARGHSGKLLLGRRVVVPNEAETRSLAAAGGFVSTAADLARFFASLDPAATDSLLSPASRREMVHALWRDPHSSIERSYGLGILRGKVGDWDWFGHSGSFPGTISCTLVLPGRDLCLSLCTNAVDGLANLWAGGAVQILRTFATHGGPSKKTQGWSGRWWGLWGACDLVAMKNHVKIATPAGVNPFLDASEIAVTGPDKGRIRLAGGLQSPGEGARLLRGPDGAIREVWIGGVQLLSEAAMSRDLRRQTKKA